MSACDVLFLKLKEDEAQMTETLSCAVNLWLSQACSFYRPCRGLTLLCVLHTAHAVGYFLTPLCGGGESTL